ncbi:MAG TPA: Rrf2 family transcriptional regulator [Candidatus Limnocylindria bacterium]|nr:Rrf2 family transcriptional regulator [Candidatus Limnocylindria bacterium]
MKLSTRAEYGIRVLVALAHADGDKPISLAGIARADKLPHAYIEQLVGALKRAGLVTATRGHSGGYRLARPAQQISLVEAVRALDGPVLEMPCAGPNDLESCDRPEDCSVHEVFERLHDSLSGMLSATTLADVAAGTGGPPYPPAVRRRVVAAHAKSTAAASAATTN